MSTRFGLACLLFCLGFAVAVPARNGWTSEDGSAPWDGTDEAGRAAASGLYFYEVRAGNETRLGKMLLVR